jgi:hypothetical protein
LFPVPLFKYDFVETKFLGKNKRGEFGMCHTLKS